MKTSHIGLRVISTIVSMSATPFIVWASGFDVFVRSPLTGLWVLISTMVGLLVYFHPSWKYLPN